MLFDLKTINAVLTELEETRGVPREKVIEAIESALATAYRKEYGKKGEIVKSKLNLKTGELEFWQIKSVVDEDTVRIRERGNARACVMGGARRQTLATGPVSAPGYPVRR